MGRIAPATVIAICLLSCAHKKTLTENLTATFTGHLHNIDTSARLDSMHILWNVAITQRMGRIIDDSIYVREYTRIRSQLRSAQEKNDKDSIEFYLYEINYMEKEIDSIGKSIGQGDTTHRYGYLIGCIYYLTKKGKQKTDSTLLYIDSSNTIRYTEYLDSSLNRTVKSMN